MKVLYTPAGSDTTYDWLFRPGNLDGSVMEVIERETGMTYNEWVTKVEATSVTALRGFLWAKIRAELDPTATYRSVHFTMDEIEYDYDDDELRGMLGRMRARDAVGADPLNAAERVFMDNLAERFPDEEPVDPADDPDDETAGPKKAAAGPKA